MDAPKVLAERRGRAFVVTINRASVRNCVDGETAGLLHKAVEAFKGDDALDVMILTGAGETAFCAGADLKALNTLTDRPGAGESGPMGISRITDVGKPTLAAVNGYCTAGGLELACWCDFRIADRTAQFGVLNRRWGVPLVDGGTVRLPRLIGHSHALDLILTGRGVCGDEAVQMGLVNRLTEPGEALTAAVALAHELSALPQLCMREDRASSYEQWGLPLADALRNEHEHGMTSLASDDFRANVSRFTRGAGRHGRPAT